jgi:hypothetical protein
MKNKQTTPKSTTTRITALCLVLAALGLPAAQLQAQGRGSPPTSNNFTITISGICSFDVLAQVTGKQGVISLPNGGLIFTAPATFATFTNLSDPTKSVTLNITGPGEFGPVQNGTQTIRLFGRNVAFFPSFGLRLLIGTFTLVIDANTGQLLQPPTGNGQMIDVCGLLD